MRPARRRWRQAGRIAADPAAPTGEASAALSRASRAVAVPLHGGGPGALADYELLELILFRAIPRRDVKPMAKNLIARFGSFAEAIAADRKARRNRGHERRRDRGVQDRRGRRAALCQRRGQKRLPMGSWSEVIDYCRTRWRSRAGKTSGSCFSKEERADRRRDPGSGTVDHTPVYPREVSCAGARTVGDGDRARAQPPLGRSDAFDPGHQDDLGHHRNRQDAGRRRP